MRQKFDMLEHYKRPKIKLCKPNREGVGYLNEVSDLKIKLVFNAISEMTFTVYKDKEKEANVLYDLLKFNKVLFADDYGYFIVTSANMKSDGELEYKEVTAYSAEYELIYSRLSYLSETIKLYNPLNGTDTSTLIGRFLKANPKWKIGTVDSELWNIYRTYDVSSTNWYNFLVSNVEKSCQCIFKFDNVARIVSIRTTEKSTKKTGIYISHKNLIVDLSVDEKADEVFTSLNCYGGGNLDIAMVNPLGTNAIYNLGFFKTEEWMDTGTINAVTAWEKKVNANRQPYINILYQLRLEKENLVTKRVELTELQNKYKSVEVIIAQKISQGITSDKSYSDLIKERTKYTEEIKMKVTEINTCDIRIDNFTASAKAVNTSLSFEKNFTAKQIDTINSILKTDDYQNDSFIKTEKMNEAEIQEQSQLLYAHCLKILDTVSKPRYYFKGQLVNFVFMKDFEQFTKQLELGCVLKARIKRGWTADLVLLSMSLNFDDPTDFEVEFSNRQLLDNGAFAFDDIYSDNSNASTKVNWDSLIWGEPVKSGQTSQVDKFMNSNFDAAKNALMSAKGIGVLTDGSGIHLRKYVNDVLQPCESWLIDDMFAMSDDNFNTAPKIALGRFKLPNSNNYAYGVNAEFLAGKLVCGNNFLFENYDKNTKLTQFRFDANGAYLYNSKITVENNFSQIKLDPNNASVFSISGRANVNQAWAQKIFMDTKGNANFVGKLTASEGSIGGWNIGGDGLYSPFGDYIKNSGNVKLSVLTLTPNSGTFNGNVYAKNLVAGGNNGFINNNHINNNTISGAKVSDNSVGAAKLSSAYKDGVTTSIGEVKTYANNTFATTLMFSRFKTMSNGEKVDSFAGFETYVNENYATAKIFAKFGDGVSEKFAGITAIANGIKTEIVVQADKISFKADKTYVDDIEVRLGKFEKLFSVDGSSIFFNAFSISTNMLNVSSMRYEGKSIMLSTLPAVVTKVNFNTKQCSYMSATALISSYTQN